MARSTAPSLFGPLQEQALWPVSGCGSAQSRGLYHAQRVERGGGARRHAMVPQSRHTRTGAPRAASRLVDVAAARSSRPETFRPSFKMAPADLSQDHPWPCGVAAQGIDRSRAPHRSPRSTTPDVVSKILYLRQRYHFGPGKIAGDLQRFHAVTIAVASVHRVLQKHGMNRLPANQKHRHHHQRWQRYEKPRKFVGWTIADRCANRPRVLPLVATCRLAARRIRDAGASLLASTPRTTSTTIPGTDSAWSRATSCATVGYRRVASFRLRESSLTRESSLIASVR